MAKKNSANDRLLPVSVVVEERKNRRGKKEREKWKNSVRLCEKREFQKTCAVRRRTPGWKRKSVYSVKRTSIMRRKTVSERESERPDRERESVSGSVRVA